ncbi:helix-turn-helix transcriptional regulator [Paenibacillus sp. PR3]|uniref:Helix-turn-helix transcriptional regulator n=2 Tax=Paenibacillus terricola TaxID=2763503 RepID=A0ABR8MT97_9BACL|nr:helix-turn-helix transcriptional regulator [Paenibacillus terricola]
MFREAEREWVPGDQARETRVKSVWYRLIQELHEAAHAGDRQSEEEGIDEALRQFKEKLDTGFASDVRITELAEQTGFSPVYMRRTFDARYGRSPKEYLDQLRYEHAVRRLRFTSDAITDVAASCGYADVYQFSKAFKKRNGLSPSEYRRSSDSTLFN